MFAEVGPLTMDDAVMERAKNIMQDDPDVRVFRNANLSAATFDISPGPVNLNLRSDSIIMMTPEGTNIFKFDYGPDFPKVNILRNVNLALELVVKLGTACTIDFASPKQ